MPNIKYTQQISTGKKDITSLNLKNHNDANQKIKAVKSNLQQGIKDSLELRNKRSDTTSAITNLKQVAKATDLDTQKLLLDDAIKSLKNIETRPQAVAIIDALTTFAQNKHVNNFYALGRAIEGMNQQGNRFNLALGNPNNLRTIAALDLNKVYAAVENITNIGSQGQAIAVTTALTNFANNKNVTNLKVLHHTMTPESRAKLLTELGLGALPEYNQAGRLAVAGIELNKVYESVANILIEKVTNVENLFKIQMQIQETQSNEQQSALEMYKAEKNNLESVDTEAVSNKMIAQQQNKIRAASAKTLEVRAKNDLNIKATNNLDNARLS